MLRFQGMRDLCTEHGACMFLQNVGARLPKFWLSNSDAVKRISWVEYNTKLDLRVMGLKDVG
jgi:hypothetical protein